MATRKRPPQTVTECKPTTPPDPATSPDPSSGPDQYTRPWCAAFLAVALDRGNAADALEECGVSLGTYLRTRRTDPGFDADCEELDTIERLAALAVIQSQAARGDAKAVKQLADGLGELLTAGRDTRHQAEYPGWLKSTIRAIELGEADPFVLKAMDAAGRLAEQLQRQGRSPESWQPGQEWKTTRFLPSDVARIWPDAGRACETCGALPYRIFDRLDSAQDLDEHDQAEARWSSDPGFRCPTCGARAGLPFDPAGRPPPSIQDRQRIQLNMRSHDKN